MSPADVFLHVLSRFVHVGSVILFLGGAVYARQVLVPTLNSLPEELRLKTASGVQRYYRTTLYILLALIVGSGLYNFFSYSGPKHGESYQIWFGVKMLFVAHILSSAILWATSPYGDVNVGGKSKRRLMSIAISGIIVVAISAYLRSLSLAGR